MDSNLTNDRIDLSIASKSVNSGYVLQSNAEQLPVTITQYLGAATADNTRRAYRQDLADFQRWGGSIPALPETLAAFIAERTATLSTHTISRRVVGISRAHATLGLPDPSKSDLVRSVLRGIRRRHGKPQRQVTPLLKHDLLAMLAPMSGVKGVRDRALLLLGFAAALRRSELVALDVEDLEFVREGMVVCLRRSKTDQESAGRRIAVPFGKSSACAVSAVRQWTEHAQIASGAIFRAVSKNGQIADQRLTSQSVALVVKQYAIAAGLPPENYSGHSLRAGLVTSAAQAGASAHQIMAQSGHRSIEMLNRYIRNANLFQNNAAGAVL